MAFLVYYYLLFFAIFRIRHRRCAINKGVLKILTKFKGNQLCWSLFCNKVTSMRPATLFKKELQHMCFPVKFAKLLRTLFIQNTSGGRLRIFLRWNLIFMLQRCCLKFLQKRVTFVHIFLSVYLSIYIISKLTCQYITSQIYQVHFENHHKVFSQKYLTLQYLLFTERSYILKQTCRFQLQVCLSVYDPSVVTRH